MRLVKNLPAHSGSGVRLCAKQPDNVVAKSDRHASSLHLLRKRNISPHIDIRETAIRQMSLKAGGGDGTAREEHGDRLEEHLVFRLDKSVMGVCFDQRQAAVARRGFIAQFAQESELRFGLRSKFRAS